MVLEKGLGFRKLYPTSQDPLQGGLMLPTPFRESQRHLPVFFFFNSSPVGGEGSALRGSVLPLEAYMLG